MRKIPFTLFAPTSFLLMFCALFVLHVVDKFYMEALTVFAACLMVIIYVLLNRSEAASLRSALRASEKALAESLAALMIQKDALEAQRWELDEREQSLAQMQNVMAQASGRFQELFQGVPVSCVCYNRQGEIMEWNQAFEHLHQRNDLLGRSVWETIYSRIETPQVTDAISAALNGEARAGVEWTRHRVDGTKVQLYSSIFPLRNTNGEITGVISADVDISAQHEAEAALRASEERLHALYNTTSQQGLTFEAKMALLLQRGGEQFGLEIGLLTRQTIDRHEIVYALSPGNVIVPGDSYAIGKAHGTASLALAREKRGNDQTDKSGTEVTLGAPVRVDGEVWGMLCFAGVHSQPISFGSCDREMIRLMAQWIGGEIGRQQAEEAVRESEERFRSAIESMSEGLLVMDTEGVISLCNESAEQILQLTQGQVQRWKPLNENYVVHREDGSEFPQGSYPLVVSLQSAKPQRNVVMGLPREDGGLLWVSVNSNPLIRPGEKTPYAVVATFSNITERRRAEDKIAAQMAQIKEYAGVLELQKTQLEEANAQLEDLAMLDGLTGMGNRRAFSQRLDQEISRAARYSTPLSLIIFDLDNFKEYNDTYGHPAGDEILKQLAVIVKEQGRDTDFFARYGGEEFAVLLPHTDTSGATIVAERLRRAIESAIWPSRQVTASFGAATLMPNLGDEYALVGEADRALYAAKAAGRNCAVHAQSLPPTIPLARAA